MSVVAPNILTKRVLVLLAASLVSAMMKASSEEALCPLVDIMRVTGRSRQCYSSQS